ncbi:MAG TPA: polysaccharide biosynthesis/export family protein [Thermosynechococcaceae cyanobacterium]
MIKGIRRSAVGITLAALAGTVHPIVVLAQVNPPLSTPAPPDVAPPTDLPVVPSVNPPGESAYTIGAGDAIRVDSYETPELVLDARYTVLLDGNVNLPWIGPVSVKGLTLTQASEVLSARYRRFIRNPIITVSLTAPRPLKIGVIGEINRPGSYIISVIGNESTTASLSQRSVTESGSQWPTVSKAIQTAGGITQLANVRQIQIRRPQSDGETETINVDLWKFLQEGDLTQDLILRDGDSINVPKATTLDAEQALQVAASNFSPEFIKVNVVGEVVTPGVVSVRPNTTLNQAILASGGLRNNRARKNNVELVRLNPNGSVTRRSIAMDLSQGLDEKTNPPLYNNDVVIIHRNGLAGVTDFVGAVLQPVNGLFGLFSIFGGRR